jgi:hypothetical protein
LRYELSHVDWTPDGEWLFSGSSRKALIKRDGSDTLFADTPYQFLSVVR